jgi:hypothetical protein
MLIIVVAAASVLAFTDGSFYCQLYRYYCTYLLSFKAEERIIMTPEVKDVGIWKLSMKRSLVAMQLLEVSAVGEWLIFYFKYGREPSTTSVVKHNDRAFSQCSDSVLRNLLCSKRSDCRSTKTVEDN